MTRSIIDQATWLVPAYHYSQWSNWGNTEAMGMLYASVYLPEIHPSEDMRDLAISAPDRGRDERAIPARRVVERAFSELSHRRHREV